MEYNTYFYDEAERRIASFPGLVPVTVGMMLKINGGSYIVDVVQFNLDNHDGNEELGLQAFCKTNT
jgi:hypothetical protein